MPVLGRNLRGRLTRVTGAGAVAGGMLAAWSLYEAQWVETLEVEVLVPGLHEDLRGFRMLHLSDFHLGTFSLNGRSLRKAVDWGREQHPDLVAVTGDLVSRRRGAPELHRALSALAAPYGVHVVLGNHDLGRTRDPLNQPGDPAEVESAGAVLHAGSARSFEVGSARLQVVGVDPVSFRRRVRPGALVDQEADLRILLCHFPDVVRWLEPDDFDLTLAGHLARRADLHPDPAGKACGSNTFGHCTGRGSIRRPRDSCTSRGGSARVSCPSGSSPGQR